jgi:hypothetical protein
LAALLSVEETDADGFEETDAEIASLPAPALDLALPAFPELPTEKKAPRHNARKARAHRVAEREFEAESTPRFRSVHRKPKRKPKKLKPRKKAPSKSQSQPQSAAQTQEQFARQLDRRFAPNMMSAINPETSLSALMASVPQMNYFQPSVISAVNPVDMKDALFDPFPPIVPTSPNGQPMPAAPSLTSNFRNYMYAAAPPQPYVYPIPPKIPLITNGVSPALQPGSPSLLESGAVVSSSSQQQLLRPYEPSSVPSWVPGRSPSADLMKSGYQSFSNQNWPADVSPPPSYYLPPDVVGI